MEFQVVLRFFRNSAHCPDLSARESEVLEVLLMLYPLRAVIDAVTF